MKVVELNPEPFGPDQRFAGLVSGADFSPREDQSLHAFVVSFAPAARTAWHSHANGQLLICTAGRGFVGRRTGAAIELLPGRAVWTPPGEAHWHGASADSSLSHIAVQTRPLDAEVAEVVWLEPVALDEAVALLEATEGAPRIQP